MRPLLVVLAACSQAVPTPPQHFIPIDAAADASADATLDAAPLPDVPYKQLDRDQRTRFMKEVLTPRFAILFREFDPVKFAKFDCVTCHPSEQQFAMPDPKLPRLDTEKHDPRVVDWMMNVVKPELARVLRDKEVDCARCHVGEFR